MNPNPYAGRVVPDEQCHGHVVNCAATLNPLRPYPQYHEYFQHAARSEVNHSHQSVMFLVLNFDVQGALQPCRYAHPRPEHLVNQCIDHAYAATPSHNRPCAVDSSVTRGTVIVTIRFPRNAPHPVRGFHQLMSNRFLLDRHGMWSDSSRHLLPIVAQLYGGLADDELNESVGCLPTAALAFVPFISIR
jgi:hypothetical protein